jgi:hypothetical protein
MLFRKSPRQTLLIAITTTLLLAACNVGATPAPTIDANAINTAALGTAMAQISSQQTMTALAAPSATSPSTSTPASLATGALPTGAGAIPTTNTGGVLPTVSFNTTPGANTTPLAGFTNIAGSPIAPTSAGGIGNTAEGCNDGAFVGETLPDKSVVGAGKDFTKAWEIKNTGTCDWGEGYVFAFQPDLSSPGIEGYDIVINNKGEITKPNHSQSFIVKLTAPTTPGEYKGYWKLKTDGGAYFGPLVYFDIVVK